MTRYTHSLTINVVDQPSWVAGQTDKTWFSAPNPNTDAQTNWIDDVAASNNGFDIDSNKAAQMPHYVTHAWSSAVMREDFMSWVANGGHEASNDNASYSFGPFTSESPKWFRDSDPTQPAVTSPDDEYYPDGRGGSRHVYSHVIYIPALGTSPERGRRAYFIGSSSVGQTPDGNVSGGNCAYHFDSETLAGGDWDLEGSSDAPESISITSNRNHGGGVWDSHNQRVFFVGAGNASNRSLRAYDPVTRTIDAGTYTGDVLITCQQAIYDPDRRVMFAIAQATAELLVVDLNQYPASMDHYVYSVNTPTWPTQNGWGIGQGKGGFERELNGGAIVYWPGGDTLYKLNVPSDYRAGAASIGDPLNSSASYSFSAITNASAASPPDPGFVGNDSLVGIWGQFRYVPSINCFATFYQAAAGKQYPVWCYKIPDGGL